MKKYIVIMDYRSERSFFYVEAQNEENTKENPMDFTYDEKEWWTSYEIKEITENIVHISTVE